VNCQHHKKVLFRIIAGGIVVFSGCARQTKEPLQVRPGAKSAAEALSILRSRSQNAVPLRANGQCRLRYYAEGKEHNENFPVKLWVNPPVQIYLQGDVAFDAKGIVLGSNGEEFWLSMRPKEISSYWWGLWSEGRCLEKLMIDPELVLEALGIAAIGSDQGWSLSSEGAFDILTRRDEVTETHKIYLSRYDYLVSKIGYLGPEGKASVVVELGKYKQVTEGFFAPDIIKIIKPAAEGGEGSVSIILSLDSIKPADFMFINSIKTVMWSNSSKN
jgi:hypothetical protein